MGGKGKKDRCEVWGEGQKERFEVGGKGKYTREMGEGKGKCLKPGLRVKVRGVEGGYLKKVGVGEEGGEGNRTLHVHNFPFYK